MDLSKIALPTFVLEPRSLLERITDFFSHPDLIFGYVAFYMLEMARSGQRADASVVLELSMMRKSGLSKSRLITSVDGTLSPRGELRLPHALSCEDNELTPCSVKKP